MERGAPVQSITTVGMAIAMALIEPTMAHAQSSAPPSPSTAVRPDPVAVEIDQLWNQEARARQAGLYVKASEFTARLVALVARVNGNHSVKYADALDRHAYNLTLSGRAAEAEPLRREVLALSIALQGERHPDTITSTGNLASTLVQAGRPAEAEPLFRKVLALRLGLFGYSHPATISTLGNLAQALDELGRSAEAEPLWRRAANLSGKVVGERHRDTLLYLSGLAYCLGLLGRQAEAEPLHRKLLALRAETLGDRHPSTLSSLNGLAMNLTEQGRSAEAEPLFRKALALRLEVLGKHEADTIVSINNLALHLINTGRAAEAEPLYREALELESVLSGPDHPATLAIMSNLAHALDMLDRPAEAEPLNRKVLEMRTASLGERHPDTLTSLDNLAHSLTALGRSPEALALLRKSLALRTEILGERHPSTLVTMINLAYTLGELGQYAEAERLDRRGLALCTEILGERHPTTLIKMNNLARTLSALGRPAEAEALDRKVVQLRQQILGELHPYTLTSESNLAVSLLKQRSRGALALEPARRAVAGWRTLRAKVGFSAGEEAQLSRDEDSQQGEFRTLVDADWAAAKTRPAEMAGLRSEAFLAVQDATAGTTSRAVALAAARRLATESGGELATLAAEREARADQWLANERALTKALAENGPDIAAKMGRLRMSGKAIEDRIAAIDARLRSEAPTYFSIARPEPLPLDRAQALLRSDEAMLVVLPTRFGTHVMAVTREGVQWSHANLTADQITAMVTALRATLDPSLWADDEVRPFDRTTAYKLYRAIVAPLLPTIRGKTRLFVAADGALASLPFGVLVASKPQGYDGDPAALRATDWFNDRFALIQLPSFQSFQFLRIHRSAAMTEDPGGSDFQGFGDPVLRAETGEEGKTKRGRRRAIPVAAVMGIGLTRDGAALADVSAIRNLPNLPGTGLELEQLREALGASPGSLHLREGASEPIVKSLPLDRASVIAFATHGVMAGEIRGLGEPGLILTPPLQATKENDGYLSASEITALRLNADWVILSACNTASGGEEGGQGLSGLARAFFYAGARNLLVSHWPVRDDIAPTITADTLRRLRADPGLNRAVALQQAIRAVRGQPGNEHPWIWAPFALVGAGE